MSEEPDNAPSPNGDNGRRPNGRFAKGNPGGPGNPMARKVGQYRRALVRAVTAKDIAEAVKALVAAAKAGELPAIRELLDRCIGRPTDTDLIARLESLEQAIDRLEQGEGTTHE